MTQNIYQFQRSLLRIGSISLILGAIIAIISTISHASTEDPSNFVQVFTTYASDDSWIAVHIGQFTGVIMVFAGWFIALSRLLVQSESSLVSVLAWIGLALAIMTASVFAILQAVDGISNKLAIDTWMIAPSDEKAITFGVAEGVRFIEIGTNSYFRILQGTVGLSFGIAILKSNILSRSIGIAGVVTGAATIYAGLDISYQGFSGLTTELGISMIIYFIWVGILGGLMWKKSISVLNTNHKD
ncbi:MAG TPA: hypothetical protein VFG45_01045 [Candidatus Nitrosocosmicus sp.]|nr:hypothetical protein [Candidatus Nitrosocosmicus sp.]